MRSAPRLLPLTMVYLTLIGCVTFACSPTEPAAEDPNSETLISVAPGPETPTPTVSDLAKDEL